MHTLPFRFLNSALRSACLALLASAGLSACGGGGGGGGSSALVFYVASTNPANGALAVAPSNPVLVTFSLPVDPVALGTQGVRVGVLGQADAPGTLAVVSGSGGRVVSFTPQAPLAGGTQYAILVSSFVRSTTGDAVGGPLQFLFQTSGGGGGVVIPPASSLRAAAGRLQIGRRLHTATPLLDGRVLFAGGFVAGTTITDRAETYDTTQETFTILSGRMVAPRSNHAAVRLTDGRVLLCGGYLEAFPGTLVSTRTAELFDPATNTFSATGDLGAERVDHALNRLPDGRILVTGGGRVVGDFLEETASTEIYDPATGTFSPSTPMVHSHATHGAVDLTDGRILIVGGSDTDLRPELYSISAGTFTAFAPAAADRGRYGAAVARTSSGNVVCVGGERAGQVLFFDRVSGQLINSGSPTSVPRAYATATSIGAGRVLVAGGIDFSDGSFILSSCDLIVEGGATGSTTYGTDLHFPTGIAMHTATALGAGRVLFAGGLNPVGGQPELSGAWIFTP